LVNPRRPIACAAEEECSAMAHDITALQAAYEHHAQTVANLQVRIDDLQRAVEQLAQQQALCTEAILRIVRGQWDAPQHGPRSAESVLVALNPALQGKVDAVAFNHGS
jgi:TolA-binding protein